MESDSVILVADAAPRTIGLRLGARSLRGRIAEVLSVLVKKSLNASIVVAGAACGSRPNFLVELRRSNVSSVWCVVRTYRRWSLKLVTGGGPRKVVRSPKELGRIESALKFRSHEVFQPSDSVASQWQSPLLDVPLSFGTFLLAIASFSAGSYFWTPTLFMRPSEMAQFIMKDGRFWVRHLFRVGSLLLIVSVGLQMSGR